MKCEKDHKNHDYIYLADILRDNENEIKMEMKDLKDFINKFNMVNNENKDNINIRKIYNINN